MSPCTSLSATVQAEQKKKSPVAVVRAWFSPAIAPREICLDAGETQSFRVTTATRFVCREGIVWLTQRGDAHDILLHAGEEFQSSTHTHIVITSLRGEARLNIKP